MDIRMVSMRGDSEQQRSTHMIETAGNTLAGNRIRIEIMEFMCKVRSRAEGPQDDIEDLIDSEMYDHGTHEE